MICAFDQNSKVVSGKMTICLLNKNAEIMPNTFMYIVKTYLKITAVLPQWQLNALCEFAL